MAADAILPFKHNLSSTCNFIKLSACFYDFFELVYFVSILLCLFVLI